MKIQEFIDAVLAGWHFTWPPVLMAAISYFVAAIFDPAVAAKVTASLSDALHIYGPRVEELKAILAPYGLAIAIPITASVLVILTLYVIGVPLRIVVRAASHPLPPGTVHC